jgi:hypothetical protein
MAGSLCLWNRNWGFKTVIVAIAILLQALQFIYLKIHQQLKDLFMKQK